MPPSIVRPWAKLAYSEDKAITAALPLIEHALDVAACGWALLTAGAWRRALEATAGRALTDLDVIRLVVLMALHDIGKANWGFQARWDGRAERVGHEPQVAALLKDERHRASAAGQALLALQREWGAAPLIPALFAHHGRPREEFGGPPPTGGRNTSWEKHSRYWKPNDGYDPLAAAAELIAQVRARYPHAWAEGEKLPETPRFVALFAGLVTLADWLGSDTKRFPVEGPYGDEREAMRAERAREAVANRGLTPLDTPAADFAKAFGFDPRGVQGAADAPDLGRVALIEAETGSGKTEAALWRWLALRSRGEVDGLFFALPTRTAAVQLHGRVQAMLNRVFGDGAVEAVLAVPGYLQAGDATGRALDRYAVRWDDGVTDARWAAERSNRYLAARVAVGTIDQALLGALRVKHAPFRAAALARSLLVVDEVHASDAYMSAVLERLLANHTEAGGHAVLLSATLGAEARARLLTPRVPTPALADAVLTPYPSLTGLDGVPRPASSAGTRTKTVRFETAGIIGDPDAIAAHAVEAARAGASVLVVRNSVAGAVAVAQAIEALAPDLAFRVSGVATLHHGRFAPSDRRLLDAAVEAAFGKGRTAAGRVLVGTQTLEQSLDLDADLLLTDLAPIDVLLQRIGRLHRHERHDRGAFAQARAVVLHPQERDLAHLLARAEHGLGPMKDGRGVYPDLLVLEATLRLIEGDAVVAIPADNRRLVEGALHPEIRERLAAGLGTAWANHDANLAGSNHAERTTGQGQSVDWSQPFRDLVYPADETISTRLGAADLLVDFDPPFRGPFGKEVARLRIPHWMAKGIGPQDTPAMLPDDGAAARFRLGDRTYTYGRWGLIAA